MAETGTNRDVKRSLWWVEELFTSLVRKLLEAHRALHGKLSRGRWASGQRRQGNSQWTEVNKGGLCWATHLGDSWEIVTCPSHSTTQAPDGQRVSLCPKVYCVFLGETVVRFTGLVRSKVHRRVSYMAVSCPRSSVILTYTVKFVGGTC